MVVNSGCLSGLFSSAGWSVFFSQACSLAEGFRSVDDGSKGGAACVVPLDFSLMLIAPRQGFKKTNRAITKINAMRKARKGQECRGFGAEKGEPGGRWAKQEKRPGRECPGRYEELSARTTF